MRFEGRIYRPPAEADSLLLQLTIGCSHNQCAFCTMYSEKKFRVRALPDVMADIDETAMQKPDTRRVFLCDGDALNAGFDVFEAVCQRLCERFPKLRRIAAYFNAGDILALTPEQLQRLRSLRFSLGYMGLESGSDSVLTLINKGATADEMVGAVKKAADANIKTSVIGLLGIGGRELSDEHVRQTAHVLNLMQPRLLAFLTTIILPQTSLHGLVTREKFTPLTDREILVELRGIIADLSLESCVLRANHVSNMLPVTGRLPKDKASVLSLIDTWIPVARDEVTCLWSREQGSFL